MELYMYACVSVSEYVIMCVRVIYLEKIER